MSSSADHVAFVGSQRLAQGDPAFVRKAVLRHSAVDPQARVLVFDRSTGRVVDIDPREPEPLNTEPARRGRPKLGVVAREVTLLPRHWDWLAQQPGGASVALRKLVEAARKTDDGDAEARQRTEAAYRFMSAMAGDLPGFEDASRALFAGDRTGLAARMNAWPAAVADEIGRFLDAGNPNAG